MTLMDHGTCILNHLPDPPDPMIPASWAEALYHGVGQEPPKRMRPREWTENYAGQTCLRLGSLGARKAGAST